MNPRLLPLLIVVCFLLSVSASAQRKVAVTPSVERTTPTNSQILPIKRVILYSNGVAYIERRGYVSGNAEINLSFKQSQVDDVLKSMVVLDLGQGKIGAVSYNSSAPPSARMAEIPFSVDAQTGPTGGIAGVLAQLQGAKVAVTSTKGTATGSILTVEKRPVTVEANKIPVTINFLVITSDTGEISSFDLSEVRSIKLLDEGTRRDLNEFANATALARRRDAKTITVTSDGSGQREMVVSYTVSAPIWKTTYRVVLDDQGKPFFQGWAIVDNVSDEDWQNVKLSLVSGSPVSFIQPIQKPFYRYRPIVPIPDDLKLSPQVYEPGTNRVGASGASVDIDGYSAGFTARSKDDPRNVAPTVQQQMSLANNSMVMNGLPNYSTGATTSVSDALVNNNSGVQTAATGEEIGDLFEYKIDQAVTVLRDRSALIPIVQTKMDGERISIYNESVRRDRPMGGMLLKNMTPLTLEAGSLTVLDRDAYAGEALMERLKPKEQRLISYALDLGTLVTVEEKENKEPAKLVKAVNGTFQVHYFETERKIYHLSNQSDRQKVVYIEYPVRSEWELTPDTPKPDITTQRYYRFRLELGAFEKKDLIVGEHHALMDTYRLGTLTREELDLFLTRRYIDAATKTRLEKLIDLQSQIAQIKVKVDALDDEEEKISDDQKRLRENIEALSKTPEAKVLITRYIDKANTQESRIEQIAKDRASLEADKQRLQGELATEIRNFQID